jgi:hypothetical protein
MFMLESAFLSLTCHLKLNLAIFLIEINGIYVNFIFSL